MAREDFSHYKIDSYLDENDFLGRLIDLSLRIVEVEDESFFRNLFYEILVEASFLKTFLSMQDEYDKIYKKIMKLMNDQFGIIKKEKKERSSLNTSISTFHYNVNLMELMNDQFDIIKKEKKERSSLNTSISTFHYNVNKFNINMDKIKIELLGLKKILQLN